MSATFAKIQDPKSIYEEFEKLEIRLILKLLKSPYLEKKIYAVSAFREIFLRAKLTSAGGV